MDTEQRLLALDYQHTLATYQQLADIRFKLLAFVPTLSGVAVALVTTAEFQATASVPLALLGFLATLGIVLYDSRNTQFYNGAITRAQHLEARLQLEAFDRDDKGGLFRSRREHRTRLLFGLPVGHDLGLALVYAPVLGAWTYAGVHSAQTAGSAAVIAGLVVGAAFLAQFLWHNGRPRALHDWWDVWRTPSRVVRAIKRNDARKVRGLLTDAAANSARRSVTQEDDREHCPTALISAGKVLRGDAPQKCPRPHRGRVRCTDAETATIARGPLAEEFMMRRVRGRWLIDVVEEPKGEVG